MSRKGIGGAAGWLLALAALAAVGWLWWFAAKAPQQKETAPRPVSPPTRAEPPQLAAAATNRPTLPPSPPAPVTIAPAPVQTSVPPVITQAGVPAITNAPPPPQPVTPPPPVSPLAAFPRPAQNVFEAQVALARQALSCGSIDGRIGPQTRAALRAFQRLQGLTITGELERSTLEQLVLETPPCTSYTIASEDLARLQPLSSTWVGKSRQSALDYETILELVAEKSQAHPNLIRQLNPAVEWRHVTPGTEVQVPDTACTEAPGRAAYLTIHLAERNLEAFDADGNLIAHFPCSIAQHVDKRPVGQLHVSVIAPHPNYTFNPEIFPESAEARQIKTKLVLPPGPNNPVGVAWIGLDKPGYGIHGTPNPEQVGRTESHGCFRLANWNAEYLLRMVGIGTPVYVEP